MIFALAALRAAQIDPDIVPIVFINSDEKRGSPTSRRHLHRLARRADRAFVLEPALGLDGKLKTARKGGGRFTIHIQGESAHAGLDPESGSSAILELSHVVQQLHQLNDPEAGVSVNVGTIDGGTRPNVVADAGSAEVDVRVTTGTQAHGVSDAKTISQHAPTLDGLGPVGDGAHARHEFCYVLRRIIVQILSDRRGQEMGTEM